MRSVQPIALGIVGLALGCAGGLDEEGAGAADTPAPPGFCPDFDAPRDGTCSFACDPDCAWSFPTREQAAAAVQALDAPPPPGPAGAPPPPVVPRPDETPILSPSTDPGYGRVDAIVAQLWPAAQRLFPRHARDLGVP